MQIKKASVELKGLSPILMSRFPLEPIEGLSKKTPEEQCEISAYRDASRELYVPAVALQRCIVNGGKFVRGKGRGTLSKTAGSCLIVQPENLLLGTKNYVMDTRSVVVPATGGRILRYRPRVDQWKLSALIEWDPTLISEKEMRSCIECAGLRAGLLDFRPEKGGPYGRFEIETWK